GASVYSSDATAAAVLTGLYTNLSTTGYLSFGFRSLSTYAGLSADEFSLWSGVNNASQVAYYRNSLSSTTYGFEFWTFIYPYIFTCNSAIQGLSVSTTLIPAVQQQLLGESKFMRAYFYFYLVNLFGDVP